MLASFSGKCPPICWGMHRVFIAYYLHKDTVAVVRQHWGQCVCSSEQTSVCMCVVVVLLPVLWLLICIYIASKYVIPSFFLIKSNCLPSVGIITNHRRQLFIKARVCVRCNWQPCVFAFRIIHTLPHRTTDITHWCTHSFTNELLVVSRKY